MFNKLKHLKDLRSQAKAMQSALAAESVQVEKSGISVIINGNLEIKSVVLNSELAKDSQEGILADCLNDAIKKAQKLMAEKLQEMGGFPGLG